MGGGVMPPILVPYCAVYYTYKIQHYNSKYFQSVSDTDFQSASVKETSGSSSHTSQR